MLACNKVLVVLFKVKPKSKLSHGKDTTERLAEAVAEHVELSRFMNRAFASNTYWTWRKE